MELLLLNSQNILNFINMKKLFIILFLTVMCSVQATDLTEVGSGYKLTMDGTSQKVSLKSTVALNSLKLKGYVTLYFYVGAAGGARIANEPIVDGTHDLYPQDSRVIINVTPGVSDVYIKGTSTQTITISF